MSEQPKDEKAPEAAALAGLRPCRRRSAVFGLFVRKERWGLSLRGWGTVLCLGGVGVIAALLWLHPFLAVSAPVEADCLVIEGWVPGYALEAGMREFEARPYRRLFTTGGPLGNDQFRSEYATLAEEAAARLRKLGLKPERVEAVVSPPAIRNRTYSSALGLRHLLEARQFKPKGINVVTLGGHARRTRLMYEKAFAGTVPIGIIALENRAYEPGRWWRSSEGVKEVVVETIGYLYARLFFRAPAPAPATAAVSTAPDGREIGPATCVGAPPQSVPATR